MLERREVESPSGARRTCSRRSRSRSRRCSGAVLRRSGSGFRRTSSAELDGSLRATNLAARRPRPRRVGVARFGLPVGVENDANAAALAEWKLGAGRGASNVVLLTLGTGVGGGIVLDGALYRGWAEIGHMVVVAGGPPCQGNCHGHGHLEALASGTAADRVARELWGEGSDARDARLARAGRGRGGALRPCPRSAGLSRGRDRVPREPVRSGASSSSAAASARRRATAARARRRRRPAPRRWLRRTGLFGSCPPSSARMQG